ncbi:MAG: cell division protein ZapB [Gemmatimonadetes bacterium]|nr:cell division protein ZapB [Gemmatimonadota bacterium]MYD60353.1 cell division protein ZapB [Gemmatimonadota bacterium]MYF72497.1 cell division protein ZapB [Gemmatimonadota bacterium]MYK50166.1 cell division protein ZapB [Gemmatimonadota bacterium]
MDINPWIVRNVKEEAEEEVEDNAEATEETEDAQEVEEEVDEEVDLMDINAGAVAEGVDRLVEAINNAVATIEDLRRENAELKQQSQALQSDISRLEEERVALCNERDRLQDIYNDNMLLIDNKAEILDKVEAMLQRLNSLNPEKNE